MYNELKANVSLTLPQQIVQTSNFVHEAVRLLLHP